MYLIVSVNMENKGMPLKANEVLDSTLFECIEMGYYN